jgi:hypothetical protein
MGADVVGELTGLPEVAPFIGPELPFQGLKYSKSRSDPTKSMPGKRRRRFVLAGFAAVGMNASGS